MITTEQDNYTARVRQNLKSILESPEFVTKPRLRKFLTYVVDHSLSGGTTLKGYHIAIDAFDKANDFDPNDQPGADQPRPADPDSQRILPTAIQRVHTWQHVTHGR